MAAVNAGSGVVHVVDDDEGMRGALDFVLRTQGYGVERWASGEAFLKGADNAVPACVLLDIRMPGVDGLAVQEGMFSHGFDFPVIMLTGYGSVAMAVRAMRDGAVDFIEKPVDTAKLLHALAAAFDRLANRDAQRREQARARVQIARLTQRERQVLDMLACGHPNKTIARELGLSARTVEVHRANTMTKLQITNFAEALRIALTAGLGAEQAWQHGASVGRAVCAG